MLNGYVFKLIGSVAALGLMTAFVPAKVGVVNDAIANTACHYCVNEIVAGPDESGRYLWSYSSGGWCAEIGDPTCVPCNPDFNENFCSNVVPSVEMWMDGSHTGYCLTSTCPDDVPEFEAGIALELAAGGDAGALSLLMDKYPVLTLNVEREALQARGCGNRIVLHIPLPSALVQRLVAQWLH
jgi:hypothetical protein